ncbi:MAG: alpha-hydroxy acid oxidase [Beijerinckiaceae bacterium]
MGRESRCYNIADLREVARRRLPRGVFDYIDKGTEDMIALGNNRDGFAAVKLLNKILVDISDVKLDAELFGKPLAMPMAVAPTGTAGLTWFQGEFELAKAASKAGIPFTLATGSNTPMEKLANEAGGRLWMQLYMWREKELSEELVKRAARNGFEALIWTVDIGHGANREHNLRNGFATPYVLNTKSAVDMLLHPGWLAGVMGRYMMNGGMPRHVNYPEGYQTKITGNVEKQKETHGVAAKRADKVSWDDVKRLRDIFPGKFLLKGVIRPDDAAKAKEEGVDGIVVSNHGGRNMDSAPSTIEMLPHIRKAVGPDLPVILDSGVRRGSDIVKALALGANCTLAGRAMLYGCATGGEAGATRAINLLKSEMKRTMAYVGAQRVGEIDEGCVWRG